MLALPTYEMIDKIYEGNKFAIYRAFHTATHEKVIVKALKAEYPPLHDVVRCRREYEIACMIDTPGVVRPIALVQKKNGFAIVMEDFGGESLHQYLAFNKLDLKTFLKIAVSLAESLGHLHQKKIIHQDIKPHNVIVNMDRGLVKITDFGIASLLSTERQEMLGPSQLEGTLAYMSPEQTGRMNRMIDYRTDFYSLGITLYEMLTGQLPFPTQDPVELIHCHIAKNPVTPEDLMMNIPKALSGIVMRCIAKNAEDRYQSAFGLKSDLEACQRMLEQQGAIGAFVIGQADKSEIFQIPETLYGREGDLSTLISAFDRVSQGSAELLLVSGYSGIGKSYLVNEIHKPVVRERGFFITGKFDPFKRHIPYHGLIQAVRQLVLQLLTESEEAVARWREKLGLALERNGQVMTDVFPELELIIGKQPDVQQLPPTESQNRFQMVMQNFLDVFAKREHPLVLFLDDLQWADPSSLSLMEFFLTNPSTSYVLFIGAYRDQEVSLSDRLMLMIEELAQKRTPISRIELTPLRDEHVKQLVADTLQCDVLRAEPIADLVMHKTNGNPFFMKQFLRTLHAEKLVTFDFAEGHWQWELEQIQEMDITDNVVEFMLAKVKMLPTNTQEALKIAASIGNTFDLQTLALAAGKTPGEAANDLWEALQEGFLVPLGTAYKFLYSSGTSEGANFDLPSDFNVTFKFLHDRVQQVAYSLIPTAMKMELHLKIGRIMLARRTEEELDELLFDTVNHLNAGRTLLETVEEKEQLARLNLAAGKRAKASTAYEPALNYLSIGVDLMGDDCWMQQYDLTFSLYLERSEAEYLCGNFDTAEECFDLLITNAKTVLEKANVYNIKMVLYINKSKYEEVVKLGVQGVKLLGINLPEKASKAAILREILKARWKLRKMPIEKLRALPVITDPHRNEAMELMLNISGGSYFVDSNLFFLLNLIALNMTLDHGTSVVTGLSYGGYGILLGSGFGKFKEGYEFGKLAIEVDEKMNVDILKSKGYFGFGTFINPWWAHIRTSIDYLRTGYQRAIDAGDLVYAVYSAFSMINCTYISGESLDIVYKEMLTYLDLIKRVQVKETTTIMLMTKGMVSNLKGLAKGPDRFSLTDDDFDEETFLRDVFADETPHLHCWYYINKLRVYYFYGAYREAQHVGEKANRIINHSLGQPQVPEHLFYYSLSLSACCNDASFQERNQYLKQLKKNQKKMANWAKHNKANFEHKHLLVEAEIARLLGQEQRAMDLYDKAIASAEEHEFLQNAAIANECAALYYISKGREKIAKVYMMEARYGFLRWGALAKMNQLDLMYPHLLANRTEQEMRLEVAATTTTSLMRTTETSDHNIDLHTVIKASRTISGEIVLEKVLATMIDIVVENAGAERGVLLIDREGDLWIEAEKSDDGGATVMQKLPLQGHADRLAVSIIQYVKRMKEHVVLHDASQDNMFAKDPYIKDRQPKSILCVPFLNQGRLVGVLYLENNLATHAFTADRLEVMNLLASQIAVSIENAELFKHQLELNQAYGKFVPHQFLRFLQKKSITDVKLGDHVQTEMTVLFADIRNFTTMSENMTPKENFEFLNDLLSNMEPSIIENRGFIDKYIGDAIMSLFDKGADDAVRAALAMLHQLQVYNNGRIEKGQKPIEIGIGINSGNAMLGTVGGNHRMDSTVISDAVNLASRIEGLTKVYGVQLLISEQTHLRLKDPSRYQIRLVDHVIVKGKSAAVSVYEVFDADPDEVSEGKMKTKPMFEEACERMKRADFGGALELFEACLAQNPADRTAKRHVERLKSGARPTLTETEYGPNF